MHRNSFSGHIISDYDILFVFCGVDWDTSIYGFPRKNVIGMIEDALIPQLVKELNDNVNGEKISYIAIF